MNDTGGGVEDLIPHEPEVGEGGQASEDESDAMVGGGAGAAGTVRERIEQARG
jgi:hypothetical protein